MSYGNDAKKLLLFEARPAKKIQSLPWSVALPSGGVISYSGTKRIHTFLSDDIFQMPDEVSGNIEILVVGGGGGGGRGTTNCGGAGGGGGVQYSAAHYISAGESVAVTIGAGGAGRTGSSGVGGDGGNTIFNTLTALGGGGGGQANTIAAGRNGGCGGGAGPNTNDNANGGEGSQGGDGGASFGSATNDERASGGGGGGGGNGVDASLAVGGNGGPGYACSISGGAVNYAGGGGGPAYGAAGVQGTGTDGGGNGSRTAAAGDGTANTGGGGGGGANGQDGGDGGSGIVIVSYEIDDFCLGYATEINIGEISAIKINGTYLNRVYSKKELNDMSSPFSDSYYHDYFNGILFIRLSDDSDPGEYISPDYVNNILAFVWKLFSNRQGENGETISFIPDGCIYPVYCEPALRPGTLSDLSASISDHFESAMQMSFGNVSLVNDLGEWYSEIDDWLWGNKDMRARLGEIGDSYADLDLIFIGKIKSPEVSDLEVTFEICDTREGRLRSIPPDHFDATTYPNAKEDILGQPIPILFGEKKNITPRRIDTVNYKFKISATHFNSGADVFELESIDAVYLKGSALSAVTHYVEDLHNGEFTLTFDPGDGEITCDAKGIQDGFDFDSSPFGAATGVYSENVADHLFFILHILNLIEIDEIDLTSFSELQAARTQAVAWYLDQDTPTMDMNRLFQKTSLYHFLPLADGTFAAKYYRKTIPAGTLELRDYDYLGYKKSKPNDGVFRDIFLKYSKDPSSGNWKQLVNVESIVEEDHDTVEPFEVETALRDDAEAASVLAFYISLLRNPSTKIETSISMIGRSLIPTDKLYVNRQVTADGHDVTIATDEVYVILEANRNFSEGRVQVKAQLDTQLAIYTVHADSPHQDVAHIDHSDIIHTDDAHGDSHTDDAHIDSPHEDIAHEDAVYQDNGEIKPHVDIPHEDVEHTDIAHGDTEYADIPYVDTGHVDHTDTVHGDAHTDISHIDSEV